MPSIEFDDDRPARSRDELLAAVRRDGLRRRYRRNGIVGGAALVLVVALAVPVLAGGDGGRRKVAATDQPTTTIDETTTTSESGVVAETTTTVVTVIKPVTTTPLVCRNSTDPRCGPFRWDPDPGPDQPGTVEITWTPVSPKAGETVTFHIKRFDPDGPASSSMSNISYGDGTGSSLVADSAAPPGGCAEGFYGPWTPPPRRPDTTEYDMGGLAYKEAGTYKVDFDSPRDDFACTEPLNPYNSAASGSVTITVSPAPA